jgi:hypothetical protein
MAAATDAQKKSWPPANYENPENLHGLIIGFAVPALTLAIICESTLLGFADLIHIVFNGLFC